MLRFRPKLGSERSNEWRCCFCLHVRTGTILIGTWHLMLHLMALVFLAAIVRDTRLIDELERDSLSGPDWSQMDKMNDMNDAMPTPLSNVEAPPTPSFQIKQGQPKDHALVYHDVDVGALVTVCTLAVTLMLIYGAARCKPSHLLPFFCLQIFDFAITVLTATGYLCYLRSIHRLVAETRRVPWRAELLQLPAPALAMVVLSAFLVAVLLKGYCINVVWRCYKYCTWRVATMSNLTPFVISGDGLTPCGPHVVTFPGNTPDYSSLLPDYEEAVKQAPPPSYHAATLMITDEPVKTDKNVIPTTAAAPAIVPTPAPAVAPTPAAAVASAVAPTLAPASVPVVAPANTMVVLPPAADAGNQASV